MLGRWPPLGLKKFTHRLKKNTILLTLLFEFLELVEMVLVSRMDGMCLLVEQANSLVFVARLFHLLQSFLANHNSIALSLVSQLVIIASFLYFFY